MAFNPIRDLSKVDRDQSIKQLGGATQDEISVIANRLKTTTRLTSQLLEVIRRKNALFKTDLEQIKTLDRRIKRVIPIIPGMTGVAGARFGRGGRGPDGQGPSMPGIPLFPTGPIGTGPRGPRPTPTETPVEQPISKEEEERQRQEEESKVESKVRTPAEIAEALAEIYGVPAEERVLSPAIIQDPRTGLPITVQPGEPLYPYPDPGKTPVILQDVITALQEEAKREKKGQVYQTPDGFLVIVDKNGVPKVISPKQLKEQREAIKNDPGAQFLILSQAVMDALPPSVGRVPMRDRRSPFTQRPGSGTTPGRTRVNRVENRIINLRRDRIRREAAARARREAEAAATRAERLKRSNAKIERRRQQEAERRRRQEERERQEGEEIIRQAQQAQADQELRDLGVDPADAAARAAAEADIARAEGEPPSVRGTGGLAGLARKIPMEAVSDYTAASKKLTNFIPSLRVVGKDLRVAPGTLGDFLGLNNPTVRNNFVDYLEGIGRVGKSVTIGGKPAYDPDNLPVNVNFIRDILRAVGLPTLDNQGNIVRENPQGLIGTKTMGFIYNFMKTKQGLPVKDLLDELFIRDKISPDAYGIFMQKTMDDVEKGRVEQPGEIYPGFKLDPNLKFEGRESLQSLNSQIDNTDVVIVLTGTIA